MIRICRGIYFNPLTAAFFVVCFLSGKTYYFAFSYLSMVLHELGHLAASCIIGLKPAYISFHPFGVNLHLKNTFVCSLLDEVILYLSGPLVNLLIAAFSLIFFNNRYLFTLNISLFFVNMLPVYPLDGGCILKKFFSRAFGESVSNVMIRVCSAFLAVCMFAVGVYTSYKTGFNYSVVFVSVLIFSNVFTAKQKYSEAAVKSMIFPSKNKVGKKISFYSSSVNTPTAVWRKYITPNRYMCVAFIKEDGTVSKVLTEEQL